MSFYTPHHSLPSSEGQRSEAPDLSKFQHTVDSKVRTFDVDRQNVVNSSRYLNWLEVGRVEYMRHIGLPIDRQTFITRHNFMVVHLEVDFRSVLQFDDEFKVLTRTVYMQDSSFGMEQVILGANGRIALTAKVVLVHINPATYSPQPLPSAFRKLIIDFEQHT